MCTSHRLDRMSSNSASLHFDSCRDSVVRFGIGLLFSTFFVETQTMSRLPSKVFCSVSHACVDLNLGHNGSPQDLIHHSVVLCILRNKYLEVANEAQKGIE